MKSGLTSCSGPSQYTAWGRPRAASNHWFSLQPWPCRPPDGFSSAYRPKASGAGWGLLGLEETRVQQWDGGPQGRGRLRAGRGAASLRGGGSQPEGTRLQQPDGGPEGRGRLRAGRGAACTLTLPGRVQEGFLATLCPGLFRAPVKAVGPSSEPWGKCSISGSVVKCFIWKPEPDDGTSGMKM